MWFFNKKKNNINLDLEEKFIRERLQHEKSESALLDKIMKLCSVLEEVKNISESQCNNCGVSPNCNNCSTNQILQLIKQRISLEVKGKKVI